MAGLLCNQLLLCVDLEMEICDLVLVVPVVYLGEFKLSFHFLEGDQNVILISDPLSKFILH